MLPKIICASVVLAVSCRTATVPNAPAPAADTHRPAFHFTAQEGWINDPNGLVYFKGQWHLGYQADWPRNWGHAVSTDLFHWQQQAPMLLADDKGGMWSGSAVVDWHNSSGLFPSGPGLVAAYTNWGPLEATTKLQTVGLAYSADGAGQWRKLDSNPVLRDEVLPDFRDPKVFWHAPTKRWIAIVSIGYAMRIYSAPDLKTWQLESTFGEGMVDDRVAWECPDLFALSYQEGDATVTKWVLMASSVSQDNFSDKRIFSTCEERYFIGTFDGHTFTAQHGMDNRLSSAFGDSYATVTWSDVPESDGRRVAIGWMSHWGYANKIPTAPWQGALSLPRVLRLENTADGVRMVQQPPEELATLRASPQRATHLDLNGATNPLSAFTGDTAELVVEFDVGSAREVGIRVREGASHATVVGYRPAEQTLFIDRSQSGTTGFHEAFALPLTAHFKTDGHVKLHIVIDRSSIEVFANDGQVYLAAIVLPGAADTGMSAYHIGGQAQLLSAQLTPLQTEP